MDSTLLWRPIDQISSEFIGQAIEDFLLELKVQKGMEVFVLESPMRSAQDRDAPRLIITDDHLIEQRTKWNIRIIDTVPKLANVILLRVVNAYEHPNRANINICASPIDSMCTAAERCYDLFYSKSGRTFRKIKIKDSREESKLLDLILQTTSPPKIGDDCKEVR
ncbi:MAG TPA: hypothetical protein PKO15_11590 [Fibrobacteria bacterium]|nr:hypothetical protein [Fibrobacteria bacterium]